MFHSFITYNRNEKNKKTSVCETLPSSSYYRQFLCTWFSTVTADLERTSTAHLQCINALSVQLCRTDVKMLVNSSKVD